MDVTLQRHFAKYLYVVPDGLRELMSDISREVLRRQPEDVYTFVADYLDALMVTRENARVAARLLEDIVQNAGTTASLLDELCLDRETADKAAAVIQAYFRKMQTSKRPTVCLDEEPEPLTQVVMDDIIDKAGLQEKNPEEAAKIIQKAFKAFIETKKNELGMLKGIIDWRVASRSAIALYRKTGATHEEVNRAATMIKAAYRGYYTRKLMVRLVRKKKAMQKFQKRKERGEPVGDIEELSEGSTEESESEESEEEIVNHEQPPPVALPKEPPKPTRVEKPLTTKGYVGGLLTQIFDTAMDTVGKRIKISDDNTTATYSTNSESVETSKYSPSYSTGTQSEEF